MNAAMELLVNSMMWQQIFWLGNSTEITHVVPLASVISPPFRVAFDMFNAGRADVDHPIYENGVELFFWPLSDSLLLETIRSNRRGLGYASNTMRLLIASADLHGVELVGTVEPDRHDPSLPAGLDGRALQAWLGRLGFTSDADGVTMQKRPDETRPIVDRRRRYNDARKLM